MGREIRKVPPDWEHPKDEKGYFKPLFDYPYNGDPEGNPEYCRPAWDEEETTHFQIYENVTEGTPVSPVFKDLNEMKKWLLEQGYSEKAASVFIEIGWAPSFFFSPEKGCSGIGIHSLDCNLKIFAKQAFGA